MIRTVANSSSTLPDVAIINDNNFDLDLKFETTLVLNSDDAGRFQLLVNGSNLTAYDISGSSASGVQATISPQYITLQSGTRSGEVTVQQCTVIYRTEVKAKNSCSLIFKGSLPGDSTNFTDKWWIKSFKVIATTKTGETCNNVELSTTSLTSGTYTPPIITTTVAADRKFLCSGSDKDYTGCWIAYKVSGHCSSETQLEYHTAGEIIDFQCYWDTDSKVEAEVAVRSTQRAWTYDEDQWRCSSVVAIADVQDNAKCRVMYWDDRYS
jgi:hypothetical protein